MKEEIENLRKKLKKQSVTFEIDESDIPVHERRVKEEDIKTLKKKI